MTLPTHQVRRGLALLPLLGLLGLAASGCSDPDFCAVDTSRPPEVTLMGTPPESLCDLNLLGWDGEEFSWNERVVPYDMNTPLFTDYALKARAVYIPEGQSGTFDPTDAFDLPVGSVLVKHFYFASDLREPDQDLSLIETRLLIHTPTGWEAWPYVWNRSGTEARLAPSGDQQIIEFIDAVGDPQTATYLVPQRNQCQQCHEIRDDMGELGITPIGPKARHLNLDRDYGEGLGVQNQLEHLASLGMLSGLPDIATVERATDFGPIEANGHASLDPMALDLAARDYLDINCAHCHNPDHIQGITSNLWLNYDNTDPFTLGVCKTPGSAGGGTGGFTYDIVPGNPDESILVYRVETDEVGAMMPLLGRSLVHARGGALLREWVAQMPADDCAGSAP